jgi:multidrug resistance efflux pump
MAIRVGSRRSVVLLALAGLLIYVAWIGGPYLRSIIVRDAAVTTWINHTASPIRGYVDEHPLYPGERVGADGRIATVEDALADQTPVVRAEADLERAQDRLQALEQRDAILNHTVESRSALAAAYAAAFKQDLDSRIAAASSKLTFIKQRLALERIQAGRLTKLAAGGHSSQAAADAEAEQVADLQRTQIEIQTELDRTTQRRRDAEQGTLLLDDGTDAAIAARDLDEARILLSQTESDIIVAKVDIASARNLLAAAKGIYETTRRIEVQAPPGALVWSLITAPGAAVQPGAPVASWIDCSDMLIDVPVSDVELALLTKGAPANVILEGEQKIRRGTILLTRGAASTIGQDDLAAIAKGRYPGVGQVLVRIQPTPADVAACPIGQAAHVDFPEVGLIDIVRARLRL